MCCTALHHNDRKSLFSGWEKTLQITKWGRNGTTQLVAWQVNCRPRFLHRRNFNEYTFKKECTSVQVPRDDWCSADPHHINTQAWTHVFMYFTTLNLKCVISVPLESINNCQNNSVWLIWFFWWQIKCRYRPIWLPSIALFTVFHNC